MWCTAPKSYDFVIVKDEKQFYIEIAVPHLVTLIHTTLGSNVHHQGTTYIFNCDDNVLLCNSNKPRDGAMNMDGTAFGRQSLTSIDPELMGPDVPETEFHAQFVELCKAIKFYWLDADIYGWEEVPRDQLENTRADLNGLGHILDEYEYGGIVFIKIQPHPILYKVGWTIYWMKYWHRPLLCAATMLGAVGTYWKYHVSRTKSA